MRKPIIEIGTRGTLKEFKHAYTFSFLKEHGFKSYGYKVFSATPKPIVLAETVNTKYGELIVKNDSLITYVGHGIWSVSRDDKER